MVFGTDRLGFDNPHNKIITICFHGEMDITIDFGSIIEGSSPSGSTINPLFLGLSSDFVVARFFLFRKQKNRTHKSIKYQLTGSISCNLNCLILS